MVQYGRISKLLCKVKGADTKDNIVFFSYLCKMFRKAKAIKIKLDWWLPDAEGWKSEGEGQPKAEKRNLY